MMIAFGRPAAFKSLITIILARICGWRAGDIKFGSRGIDICSCFRSGHWLARVPMIGDSSLALPITVIARQLDSTSDHTYHTRVQFKQVLKIGHGSLEIMAFREVNDGTLSIRVAAKAKHTCFMPTLVSVPRPCFCHRSRIFHPISISPFAWTLAQRDLGRVFHIL